MIDIKRKYLDKLTAIFSAYCPKAEIKDEILKKYVRIFPMPEGRRS
ncbi:MAG: hypothetical protein K2K90_11245 [Lachnospiraceae bacterium]|nr:hypothetical protein [Lachnospiraceae bacterium]